MDSVVAYGKYISDNDIIFIDFLVEWSLLTCGFAVGGFSYL